MKGYLVAEVCSNNNMEKKTMRLYTDLEDVIEKRWEIIERKIKYLTKINYLHSLYSIIHPWGMRVYDFEIGKDEKPKLITVDITNHFTMGDERRTCIIPKEI